MGWGGCHHCSGTSKDSSADVSKQDGCQVSLVNYLRNKNRLVFMRHARVRALLCGFLRSGHLFSPDLWTCSKLFKSEWGILFGLKYLLITQREAKRFVVRGHWISDCPLLSLFRKTDKEKEFKKSMPMALFFCLYGSCHPLFQRRKQQGIIICVWYVLGLKAWQASWYMGSQTMSDWMRPSDSYLRF